MLISEKILIVHYFPLLHVRRDKGNEMYHAYKNHILKHHHDESVEHFFVVSEEMKVECINPRVIAEEEFVDIRSKLSNMEEEIQKFFLENGKKQ